MFNQLTPVYLSSLIPQKVNAISHHNLRNSNDIHSIRSNTSLYHNSFLPSTLRQWNNLPVEARQLNTLSSFKTFLKKDLQSVLTYYYCGSRKAQILHARLRTGCRFFFLIWTSFTKILLNLQYVEMEASKIHNTISFTADSTRGLATQPTRILP